MLTKHTEYKYKTLYTGHVLITRCFTNDMVNLQCVAIKIRYNIHRISTYKYDTNIEYINPKNMYDDIKI